MNPFNYYVTLKIAIKKQNKEKEVCLKYAKPCNLCGSREREGERAAFYTNKQEENLINKARVGENSTLKNIYKNKKGRHSARNLAYVFLFCI